MINFYTKKIQQYTGVTRRALKFLIPSAGAVLLSLQLVDCSRGGSGSSSLDITQKPDALIPMSVVYKPKASLALEGESSGGMMGGGLDLVNTATNMYVKVGGCASGYALNTSTQINSGVVNLYKTDHGCVVKLQQFTLTIGGVADTYSNTGVGSHDFTTWLVGDTATFLGTGGSTDLVNVYVISQASQGGVQGSDTVQYAFTDIASGSTNNVSQANVSSAVPLSVSGQAAPNFTMSQARFLSTNADGSANMSMTLQCGVAETGSSAANYACSGMTLSSQLSYILISDAYSQGTITVAQALAAFSANSPTSVGVSSNSYSVAPGGNDGQGNTLTNGGFYTPSLVTGSTPIYPSNLNNVFMLRAQDSGGNTLSFLYFYVDIASITQS